MEKLLHERLRNTSVESCTGEVFARAVGVSMPECAGKKCDDCIVEVMEKLADEIERCYIPRPRFEDGTPMQCDDQCVDKVRGTRFIIHAFDDNGSVYGMKFDEDEGEYDGDIYAWWATEIERYAPKVLDADGVEIKAGDMVWMDPKHRNKADNPSYSMCGFGAYEKMEVLGISCVSAKVISDGGIVGFAYPEWITHREPDSLLKVRDSLGFHYDEGEYEKIPDDIERLTALIERGV